MVTEQWKILIKPATSKKMVESRDRRKMAMRDAGWKRRRGDNCTVPMLYVLVCLLGFMYFNEYSRKGSWLSQPGFEYQYALLSVTFLVLKKSIYLFIFSLTVPPSNLKGSHLHKKESQMWNELNSEPISYGVKLTSQLTKICFSFLSVSQVEFYVAQCLLKLF